MKVFQLAQMRSRCARRLLRLGLGVMLGCGLILLTGADGFAQFSLPTPLSPSETQTPSEVTRLGSIEVAPVQSPITGDVLFEVAGPTVYNRSALESIPPNAAERRAEEVNARIRRATFQRQQPLMDLDTLSVGLAKLNDVNVVIARDQNYPQPLVLVTITQLDADYQGVPISQLGEKWSETLAEELRSGIQQLSPEQFRRDVIQAAALLSGLVVLTVVLMVAKHWIKRYQRRLHDRKKALSDPPPPEVPADPQAANEAAPAAQLAQQRDYFLQGLDEILSLDRRLNVLSLLQWLLFWLSVLTWYLSIYWLFTQFPYLEPYSDGVVGKPIQLLGVWFVTGLLIRLMRRLIDRFTHEREGFDFGDVLTFGDVQRRQLRVSTIAGATKGLVSILLVSVGVILALQVLGLPTGSVLAIGGIFGLAISFGSQNLVKDLVNGFLILAEDQYAIGDVIDLEDAAGLVEGLNLRVTQLRSADGELVTIPNSNINQVKNLTRSWSRVNFSIDVAYQTDPVKALKVLNELATAFYDEPDWRDKILAPPDVLGIDSVSHMGLTITVWIQTAPSQQWAVGREFRLRVRQALADHDIEIGTPRQTYHLEAVTRDENGQHRTSESGAIAPN